MRGNLLRGSPAGREIEAIPEDRAQRRRNLAGWAKGTDQVRRDLIAFKSAVKPFDPMALMKKAVAAGLSRFSDNLKSIVSPSLSTARYK